MAAVRRPIFGFLWPDPDPGPLDGAATQQRWVRVCSRGPWRWGFLILMSFAVITAGSAALAAALARPGWVSALLALVILVPLVSLLARAWVVGTYVSDRGVKVSSVLTTEVLPWSDIDAIRVEAGTRLLGIPVGVAGEHVELVSSRTGSAPLRTHVETASPDLWLRPQAWSAAADRLRTWSREAS